MQNHPEHGFSNLATHGNYLRGFQSTDPRAPPPGLCFDVVAGRGHGVSAVSLGGLSAQQTLAPAEQHTPEPSSHCHVEGSSGGGSQGKAQNRHDQAEAGVQSGRHLLRTQKRGHRVPPDF